MARFSVGGDDDGENGNDDRPNNRPSPKRPRISNPIICTLKRHNSGAASTSISSSRIRPSTSNDPSPLIGRLLEEEYEEESFGESDTSCSGSSEEDESQQDDEEHQNPQSRVEMQPTEARLGPTVNGNNGLIELDGPTVTLTDPHVLDCPICFEPLCAPVYQCENGHIACATCCNMMKNKCSNCCWPIGYNRCRAIENVIESIKVTCPNAQYGCLETLNYGQRHDHEKTCNYAPCSCPQPRCNFVGMHKSLYEHFTLQHSHSSKPFFFNSIISISLDNNHQKHLILQERSQGALFVLNHSVDALGTFVNVVCIAPPSANSLTMYDLTAYAAGTSIRLKSRMEYTQKWNAQAQPPTKVWLMVPRDLMSISEQIRLDLTISRAPELAR